LYFEPVCHGDRSLVLISYGHWKSQMRVITSIPKRKRRSFPGTEVRKSFVSSLKRITIPQIYCSKDRKNVKKGRWRIREESTIVIKATGRYSEKVKWMGIDKGHDPQDGEQIDRQCKKTVNYLKNLPRPFCAEDSVFLKV
jgi:endogenous inhibitor of DNA gyrase (YacG/DUF329 family)